jgi:hypothetical protein
MPKYMKTILLILLTILLPGQARAQSVLFDFENATPHSSLPISLTVGGVTAQFSATGQGFSVQAANSPGFTPAGFSGNCIYPNSVYAADLLISFSTALTDFSILYAPEEYACDSSATMRVTAYLDNTNTLIGTATTNAQAGTWPSETLRFSSAQGFNLVVVHYDKPPVTGGDWGPIFMADNMWVTPVPPPIVLEQATVLTDGSFQFGFTHLPGGSYSVLTSTNPALRIADWTALGSATEISPGQYQFTDANATNRPMCFYRVSSP